MVYFIATPIGNLEDISTRARRVLASVDAIGAEDTRHTRALLTHEGISVPLFSFHQHNEMARCDDIVARVSNGEIIAIVSDAGMPGIADAGQRLVMRLRKEGIPYTCIPGPSAVETAFVLSGMPGPGYLFGGFFPRRGKERTAALTQCETSPVTTIFFESPRRLCALLTDVADRMPDRAVSVARELTKTYEEVTTGTAEDVRDIYAARDEVKGECVALIAPACTPEEPDLTTLRSHVARVKEIGNVSHRTAVEIVATLTGAHKRALYHATLDDNE